MSLSTSVSGLDGSLYPMQSLEQRHVPCFVSSLADKLNMAHPSLVTKFLLLRISLCGPSRALSVSTTVPSYPRNPQALEEYYYSLRGPESISSRLRNFENSLLHIRFSIVIFCPGPTIFIDRQELPTSGPPDWEAPHVLLTARHV